MRKQFITPHEVPDGVNCRTLKIPDSQEWLGIFNSAILSLTQAYNYEQLYETDLTPEQCAEIAMLIYEDYLKTGQCSALSEPYWDDPEGDDAAQGEDNPAYPFYEDVATWAIAGFVAYAAGIGAALEFFTVAEQFRLAWRKHDKGGIVKIFMDAVELGQVDTYSPTPDLAFFDVISTGSTLRLEVVGKNENVVGDPETQFIRKRLWNGEIVGYGSRWNDETDEWQSYDPANDEWYDNPAGDPRVNPAGLLPPRAGSDVRCQSAVNIADKFRSIVDAMLTAGDILQAVNSIVSLIVVFFPPARFIWLVFLALTEALFAIGQSAINAAFGSEAWEQFKCIVYEELPENGQVDTATKDAIYARVNADMGGIQFSVLSLIINALGEVGMSNAGATGSASGDCSCGTWCYRFTFYGTSDGWTVERGTVTAGGINGVYVNSQTTENVQMSIEFPDTRVTAFAVDYTKTANAGANGIDAVLTYLNGVQTSITFWNNGTGTIAYYKAYNADMDKVLFGINAGTGYGEIVVRQVTLWGEGDNPFGENNCT